MTSEVLEEVIKLKIRRGYSNEKTRKQYCGTAVRLLKRVPVELFGDKDVMVAYRQLLSKPTRALFGVVWRKIYEELSLAGIPCVNPKELVYQVQRPILVARPMEDLSFHTSTAILEHLKWQDVYVEGETLYLRGVPMDEAGERALTALHDYFWPGELPPPKAPIIAMSPKMRLLPMPTEMVEPIINDLNVLPKAALEKLAYGTYTTMYGAGYSLQEIRKNWEDIDHMQEYVKARRDNGIYTLQTAVAILGQHKNKEDFNRIWEMGAMGENITVQDALLARTGVVQRPTAPIEPTVPPRKPVYAVTGNQNWSMRMNVAEPKKVG